MHEFDYYVYIVKCSDNSYYTGITNDITRRVYEHNEGKDPTSYTYSRRPLELVYTSHFTDVNEAISWEKHVKKWRRKKKEALISGQYELLPDLAKKGFKK